jgi:hypothetical protein
VIKEFYVVLVILGALFAIIIHGDPTLLTELTSDDRVVTD